MTSARSFGNYDLPSAVADLIDNSIKARARTITLSCLFNAGDPTVSILDDGHGMSAEELQQAMRPASTNPLTERSPDDLGRFGWGMKSASFSQCKCLTVLSRRDGIVCGAMWDLDDVDGWRMGVLGKAEVLDIGDPQFTTADGTQVLWSNCDRLSEGGSISEAEFNDLVVVARNRIALIFHRYLSGKVRGRKITITLNGHPVRAQDPFYADHDATQELETEDLEIGGGSIRVKPYVLPHYSKLTLSEYDRLGGEEGFLRNQGFYVYRNNRLIISGTWFRLVKHGELSQLIRVSVDIPNSLDAIWKITIDKSDAQLPALLRSRLKQIVDRLRTRSAKVFRSRGARLDHGGSISVWSRHARGGEIRYSINKEHPVIVALLDAVDDEHQQAAMAALRVIEQSFPVIAFGEDAARNIDALHQTEADLHEYRSSLEALLPSLLLEAGGELAALVERLKHTEPFSLHWGATEEVLLEKGWISAGK
ncbi:HATPase_MORC-like domain containing protein [Caulobacteraceae bacterium]